SACLDLNELLMRMFASSLRRHIRDSAFNELEQCLLHPFARHVAGNRRAVTFAADLIDLVDIDDAAFGAFDIVIRCLEQLEDDVFHVLSDVSGFGERRRIGEGEGYVQILGQRLREQRLSGARRAHHQDVALLELYVVDVLFLCGDALVVIMDRHGENFFGPFLSDDILIEAMLDLGGFLEFGRNFFLCLFPVFGDDVVAQIDTFVANVDRGSGDEFADFGAALPAERTAKVSIHLFLLGHASSRYYLSLAPSFSDATFNDLGARVIPSSTKPYRFASSPDMK